MVSTVLHLGVIFFRPSKDIHLNAAPLLNADAAISMKINIRKPVRHQLMNQTPRIIKHKNKKEIKNQNVKQKHASQESIKAAPQTTTKSFDTLISDYTQPSYPRLAIRRGLTGIVTLTLWIKGDGHVEKVEVTKSSGYESLDESARSAVREWKFKKLSTALEQAALYKVEKRIIYQLD